MMFGFKGNDAQITITRRDGVYVDGKRVEQPAEQPAQVEQTQSQGDQNGNNQVEAA